MTTLEQHRGLEQPPERLQGPVLMPRGGSGSLERWHGAYWVWPLPPEGPVAFVCEWPIADIPLTRYELDSARIRDAAGKRRSSGKEAPVRFSRTGHLFADQLVPATDVTRSASRAMSSHSGS